MANIDPITIYHATPFHDFIAASIAMSTALLNVPMPIIGHTAPVGRNDLNITVEGNVKNGLLDARGCIYAYKVEQTPTGTLIFRTTVC